MTIAFDAVESRFSELRDFVLNDLASLLKLRRGGNYAAALVIATACEALGDLRYKSGKEFFKEYMLPKAWWPVSDSLFNALRNGLAHRFATKVLLKVDRCPVELGISWTKPHLSFHKVEGCVYLVLNIADMVQSLKEAFKAYELELRRDADLRDRFDRRWAKEGVVDIQNPAEQQAWRELLLHNGASQPTPAAGD